MPPIGRKDLTMPLAAFGMVFVLGSYIYTSIGHAKRNAAVERDKALPLILQQRKGLGMDLDSDKVFAERKKRREARAAGSLVEGGGSA